MPSLDELGRLLSRALRAANDVAVILPVSPLLERKAALDAVVEAVVQLTKAQDLLVKQEPSLEYHYDPTRPPSQLMKMVAELRKQAESNLAQGKIADAAQLLQQAREMEPPPLTYESITKQLDALREQTKTRQGT